MEETTLSPARLSSSLSPISSRTLSPAPIIPPFLTIITASLRSKIRGLHNHAEWTFRRMAQEVGVAVSTVYSIRKAPATSRKAKLGRPKVLTTPIRKRLVDFATASQKHGQLPFTEVAELAGITADMRTLRVTFQVATESYHRRIARSRPFLSLKSREKRLDWAHHYADWTQADWNNVFFFFFFAFLFPFLSTEKLIERKYEILRSSGAIKQPSMWEVYLLIIGFGLLGSE